MSDSYRAVVCSELGPPERLQLLRLPHAPLAPGMVRVELKASGINFPDLLVIEGMYQHRPALPFVVGQEAAGIVAEAAPDVDTFSAGQQVIVRMQTGGYAEQTVVPVDQMIGLPAGFSFAEGATFLVAHLTAYHALATRAALAAGQSLVVLGAAGGVGLAAVQIGKALGARVIAAASTAEKLQYAARFGVGAGVRCEPLHRLVNARFGVVDKMIGVVLDPVGIAQDVALRCMNHGGKLLIAGFAGGSIPAYAANRILLRGGAVIGIRAGEAGRRNPQMRRRELEALYALAARRLIRPLVFATYPLHRYAEAMHVLASRQAIGRIALTNGD
jgi:NADPH2:quinone reductase